MSLYSDLNEVLTPYAQRIKWLVAANNEVKADLGANVNDLKTALSKVFDFDYTHATVISAAESTPVDSCDITTPGNYRINTVSEATYVANLPVTIDGRLFVFETSGSGRLCHLYIANVQAGYQWYIRSKHTSSAWTDWFLLNNTEIINALANEGDAWN